MKKIFLIMILFFVFCMSIFAYPSDFFKSYPNGKIKVKIDWDKGKGYYDANFYDGKNNKVKSKKNWEDFGAINSFHEFSNTLKNDYSNQKIIVLVSITNEEHPIGMSLDAKFYDSKGVLVREANNDRFYHNTIIYDNNGNLSNKIENNIQQNQITFKKYGKNNNLSSEISISFDYNEVTMKGYNNSNVLIVDSFYTLKDLEITNLKRTLSNLFKNANYQNVLDGYEKFYNDNGSLESEKTYKNGKLIETKEYKVNNFKEDSVNDISNLDTNTINNSNLKNNKWNRIFEYLNSLPNILKWVIMLVVAIIVFVINTFIKKKENEIKRKKIEKEKTIESVEYYYKDTDNEKVLYRNGLPVNNIMLHSYKYNDSNIDLYIEYKKGTPYYIKLKTYSTEYRILINRIKNNKFESNFTIIFGNKVRIKSVGIFKLPPWLYGNIYFYKDRLGFSFTKKNSCILCEIINNKDLENDDFDKEVKKIFFPFFDKKVYIGYRNRYLVFLEEIILKGDIEYYSNVNEITREKVEIINNNLNVKEIETFYENRKLIT